MAYFPNGTSAELFKAKECATCLHEKAGDGEGGCMILLAHLLFNYDQCSDEKLKNLLTLLIDDSNELGQMCSMRMVDIEAPDPNQMDLLGRGSG